METQKLYNPLEGFDFNLLKDPEFKEDSVREEIILPIIKGLGYSTSKPNKIIRSKNLIHPFVSIGSKRKDIYIVPDYLFEVDNKLAWILDAKSPTESIIKSSHVEQAYSYAIHPEVRVKQFALCNGLEFALFHIEKIEPILKFTMKELPIYWETLKQLLAPNNILVNDPLILKKDLGLRLKRLGFDSFESLIFPRVPIVTLTQMDPNFFSFSGTLNIEDEKLVATFDFGIDVLNQLKGKIPTQAIKILSERNSEKRAQVMFPDEAYFISIDCKISDKLEETDNEIFMPLWINSIIG